jgi:uncharacterized membrane protein YbhN (UPF0104 family)
MAARAITHLKRALPWLLSLLIVGYLFWSVDLGAVMAAVEGAEMGTLMAIMVLSAPIILAADASTIWLMFRRLLAPYPYREIVAIKGVSYFFNAITYSAGTGGIAYLVHRRWGAGFLHCISLLLWMSFIDVMTLLLIIGLGLLLAADLLPVGLATQLPYVLLGGAIISVGAIIYWRLGVDFLILGRMRTWRIFRAFADAKMADYGVMIASRTAFIGVYIVLTWLLLPTFQIEVPVLLLLVYLPIGTFVQIIPASVSGLGAVQVVLIALYSPHVAATVADGEAQVLAFTTFMGPTTTFVRVMVGYVFVRTVMKSLMGDVTLDAASIAAARRADEEADPALPAD